MAVDRSCDKKTLDESGDFIKQIEKFLEEGHHSKMPKLIVRKGRIFDTDDDLLELLGSDMDKNENAKSAGKPKTAMVPPNKKIPEKNKHSGSSRKPKTAAVAPDKKIPEKNKRNDPLGKPKRAAVPPSNTEQDAFCGKFKTVVVALRKLYEENKTKAPPEKSKTAVIPNKRLSEQKSQEKSNADSRKRRKEEEPSAIKAKMPKPDCQKESKRRGRPKKVPLKFAETQIYVEPMMETCHELPITKKQLCSVLNKLYPPGKIKQKFARIVTDPVIDLTFNESKAANLANVSALNAILTLEPEHVHTATLHQSTVQYHCPDSIDLTQDEPSRTAISEKECANKLVPMVFSCHQIVVAGHKLEDGIHELKKSLPLENYIVTYDHILNLIWSHASTCSSELWKFMDSIYVRNVNIGRFIEILAAKFSTQYKIELLHSDIADYLYMLLNRNRDKCEGFAGDMLEQLGAYCQRAKFKKEGAEGESEQERLLAEEPSSFVEVFTPQQLAELQKQISQYLDLSARQELLMATYFGFPGIEKKVKAELISEGCCFTQKTHLDGVVIILDD